MQGKANKTKCDLKRQVGSTVKWDHLGACPYLPGLWPKGLGPKGPSLAWPGLGLAWPGAQGEYGHEYIGGHIWGATSIGDPQDGGARSPVAGSPGIWSEWASQSSDMDENRCTRHYSTPRVDLLASNGPGGPNFRPNWSIV